MRTLLVLTKAPVPGTVKTRLARHLGNGAACALHSAFLRDLGRMVRQLASVRVHWWVDGDPEAIRPLIGTREDVRRQPPGDLGHRLQAAFGQAFAEGAGLVAAVGSDCPLLAGEEIDALFSAAEQNAGAALIAALDGGYAAIALARPCPAAFARIPWSTDRVASETVKALQGAGVPVAELPARYDVDTLDDLLRLQADLVRDPGRAPHTAAFLASSALPAGPRERPARARRKEP